MSTLTQILLAAVMNYLGITGEVKENMAMDNSHTATELRIPCLKSKYCNFSREINCDYVNPNSVGITHRNVY